MRRLRSSRKFNPIAHSLREGQYKPKTIPSRRRGVRRERDKLRQSIRHHDAIADSIESEKLFADSLIQGE